MSLLFFVSSAGFCGAGGSIGGALMRRRVAAAARAAQRPAAGSGAAAARGCARSACDGSSAVALAARLSNARRRMIDPAI